jgi:peptidoglycan/xylan/chitin deacetylase (PgdA/CDA1 family)
VTNLGTISARIAGGCLPSIVTRLDSEPDELFITIDDSPSPLTRWISDYLIERGATATWFISGRGTTQHPEAVSGLVSSGHTVGNHGYDHLDAWRNSWPRIEDDLAAGLEKAHHVSGYRCLWTRPPYGHLRPKTVGWCRENGQKLILWDVIAPDYVHDIDPKRVAHQIRSLVRPGSVVVLHDHGLELQRESLQRTIDGLLQDGWRLRGLPVTTSPKPEPAR